MLVNRDLFKVVDFFVVCDVHDRNLIMGAQQSVEGVKLFSFMLGAEADVVFLSCSRGRLSLEGKFICLRQGSSSLRKPVFSRSLPLVQHLVLQHQA